MPDLTLYLDVNGANCTNMHHHIPISITNTAPYPQNAYFELDGTRVYMTTVGGYGHGDYTYDFDGDHTIAYGLEGQNGGSITENPDGSHIWAPNTIDHDITPPGGSSTILTNGGGNFWTNGGLVYSNIPPTIVYTNTFGTNISPYGTGWASNGPIVFDSADTGAARDATLRAGFGRLIYDVETLQTTDGRILNILQSDHDLDASTLPYLTNLAGGIGMVGSNYVSLNLTNNVTLQFTNMNTVNFTNNLVITNSFGGVTSIVDFSSISNLLQQISNNTTRTNSTYGEVVTNASDATTRAHAYSGDGETALSNLGDVTGPPDPGSGSVSAIDIPLGTYTMHVDLVGGTWGPVWAFMYAFTSWILIAMFITKIAKDAMEFIRTLTSAQTSGVPNVNAEVFGIGGNWGAILIPAIIIGTLALLAAAIGVLVVKLASYSGLFTIFNSDFLSGYGAGVAGGIEFLKVVFPFTTAFAVTVGYIAWRAALAKAALICTFAMRFFLTH